MNARRSIRARWRSTAVLIAFAAALFICGTASAATQSINGDPIDVNVFDAGRIEPYYDNQYQYYAAKACNNVLWLNGTSIGFDAPDTSTASCSCTDFTAVSNSKPDAWTIETVYDAGSTGVRITQRVEYVNGAKYYRMKWHIENTGSSTYTDLRFMHGGDTYFGGIDSSNGAYDSGLDMVYLTNSGVTGIMGLLGTPSSPIDHYYETHYGTVRSAMCSGAHLPDTVNTGYTDAGYAVEWDRATLAPGQTWEIESVEKWTSTGDVQVFAPAGQSGYVGDTFDYSFSVQNLQSSSDTFDLSTSSSKGWTVSLPDGGTVTIGASSSETVLVRVTATSVGTDLTTLTATSQTHPTVTNDDSVTTQANPLELSPDITSHAPGSPVTDTYGSWRTFTVSVDQTVDVVWYLDEVSQHTNESVTEASYTFHADDISEHNVSAVAETANGADTQTWVWNVTLAAIIDHLIVAGITDPITSATTSGVTVTAKDEYGNTVSSYAGTIHFTTTDYSSDALLPADYTFKPVDEGAKAFDGVTTGQVVKLVTISEQTVTATDTVKSAVTGSQTVTVQTNAVTSYDINLIPGWNLISTPLMPDNSTIEVVLSGMTNVMGVYTYDALNATWVQYMPGFTQYANLTHITAEKGYWFRMSASETLTINGSFLGPGGATPPTYQVYPGWNLIGFHSLSADIPYDYLSNVRGDYASDMYGYENGLWTTVSNADGVNGTDNLETGYGYWLYMQQNGTITP